MAKVEGFIAEQDMPGFTIRRHGWLRPTEGLPLK